MTVDGEHVEYGPIQAEVFPELARVMVPWSEHSLGTNSKNKSKVVILSTLEPLLIRLDSI
jgi:hypothetical protein